jgi:hypothetical protein
MSLNPNLTCDFEFDFCDWSQEQVRDTDNFIRENGT